MNFPTEEQMNLHHERTRILEHQAQRKHKLLGCPFCGGKAKFVIYYSMHMMQDSIHVECSKCYTQSHNRNFIEATADEVAVDEGPVFSTSIKNPKCSDAVLWAVDKWNSRRQFKGRSKS